MKVSTQESFKSIVEPLQNCHIEKKENDRYGEVAVMGR